MATKKFDRTVWHGTDCNKVTSLFEYGLLVRYITKEKAGNVYTATLMNQTSFRTVG